jgi:hypothetical protein
MGWFHASRTAVRFATELARRGEPANTSYRVRLRLVDGPSGSLPLASLSLHVLTRISRDQSRGPGSIFRFDPVVATNLAPICDDQTVLTDPCLQC